MALIVIKAKHSVSTSLSSRVSRLRPFMPRLTSLTVCIVPIRLLAFPPILSKNDALRQQKSACLKSLYSV